MNKINDNKARRPYIKFMVIGFGIIIACIIIIALIEDIDTEIVINIITGVLCTAIIFLGWFSFAPINWIIRPAQKVQATFLNKGIEKHGHQEYVTYYVRFKFDDGKSHVLDCSKKTYEALNNNDSGELSYLKQPNGSLRFIRFDSVIQASVQLPVHSPLPNIPTIMIRNEPNQVNVIILLLKLILGAFGVLLALSAINAQSTSKFFAFLIASVVTFFYLAIPLVKRLKLKAMPEQQTAATVVGNGLREKNLYITFLFADGMEKTISVQNNVYCALTKGSKGILTFKERKERIVFISFEKAENN